MALRTRLRGRVRPRRITMSFTSADRTGPDDYLGQWQHYQQLHGGTAELRWRLALVGDSIPHLYIAP